MCMAYAPRLLNSPPQHSYEKGVPSGVAVCILFLPEVELLVAGVVALLVADLTGATGVGVGQASASSAFCKSAFLSKSAFSSFSCAFRAN